MSEYFSEPKFLGGRVEVEIDLFNNARKTDFKNVAGIDTSSFTKKADLANLKSNVDKLDADKLENVTTNLIDLKSKAN